MKINWNQANMENWNEWNFDLQAMVLQQEEAVSLNSDCRYIQVKDLIIQLKYPEAKHSSPKSDLIQSDQICIRKAYSY